MTTSVAVTVGGALLAMLTCLGVFYFQASDRGSEQARIAAMQIVALQRQHQASDWRATQAIEEARRQRLQNPEPFTATTDCPKCGNIDVHWIEEPHRATPDEWAEYAAFAAETIDPILPRPPVDEPWPVARVCVKCNYRWGQT